jgi:hypothetical protein
MLVEPVDLPRPGLGIPVARAVAPGMRMPAGM